MSDSEAGSVSGDFDHSVQELLEPAVASPPQQPAQEDEPTMAQLLSRMNKKLDRLQTQYDLSVKNNEALTSLVQTQQQQMNAHLVRVDALSTEREQHK